MRRSRFSSFVLGLLLIHSGPAALGQTSEVVARQQLIASAQSEHSAGRHEQALAKAQQALALGRSVTLLLFIAEEHSELAQNFEAYASAQQCVHEAQFEPTARLRDTARGRCEALVRTLTGRVGHLSLDLSAAQGAAVKIDGRDINPAALAVPFLVRPGAVTVEASAAGRRPFRSEVTVAPGETRTVVIALPREEPSLPVSAAPPVPPPAPIPVSSSPDAEVAASVSEAPSSGTGRRIGAVAAITGGALLVLGGASWLVAGSKYKALKDDCSTACSPARYQDGRSGVETWDTLAGVGLISGGILAAGGTLLYLLSPARNDQPGGPILSLDPRARTIVLSGSFR